MISQEIRNKTYLNCKEKSKIISVADYMISFAENPKEYTKTKAVRIREFSKAARYKVNTWKSVAFLYANNEQSKKEITKIIPYIMHQKE